MQQDHQHPYNDIFKQLLINPGRLNEEQMNQLQALVDRFPQMGLLHALQARYSGDTVHLSRAAAGFADSAVLQKIVLRTSGLPAVNDAQIILKNNDQNTDAVEEAQPQSSEAVTSDVIEAEPVETVSEQENVTTLEPALDVTDVTSEAQPVEEAVAEEQVLEPTPEPEAQPDEPVKENAVEENVTASEPTADPNVAINEEQPIEEAVAIAEEPASETVTELETRLDEPVNNDAVPADLPVAEPTPVTEEDSQLTTDAEVANEGKAEHVAELPVAAPAPLAETQQLIMENIAASNYFVFDTAFIDRNKIVVDETKEEVAEPEPTEPEEASASNTDEGQVTRYHDDKMPYSFLWWLDKTRSKHSATYQPYVINKPAVATVPEKIVPNTEVPEERKKEDEILERFLQEDPQMKPPTGDKLDNENKARHSSEDQDEMITETLARIYADQMLYSKAIAAYKILILKNPEKRRYFANQIEILQKKIN